MKALTDRQLGTFFREAARDFDVRVPVRLYDGTRSLGTLDEGALALCGGALPGKITAVFFPQLEWLLHIDEERVQTPASTARPLLVAGWTAADLECLEFVDRFFAANYRDSVYFSKREGAVLVAVSGECGSNGAVQRIAGGNCDIELIRTDHSYAVQAYSEKGQELLATMPGANVSKDKIAPLIAASEKLPQDDFQIVQKASELLLADKVPAEFWQRIAARCIACTACNLACPTCTCFDVFDRATSHNGTRRWRLWDSCQLDGFMREASGHNPLGEEGLRTQRRIHHKLAADVKRWGHMTCYLCGRCDRVCPTGIGIVAVCREMVEEYGSHDE
jgi:ferredoxin